MKTITCLAVVLATVVLVASGEQQRILRRVIKSTPTASNLARVRLVTVRSSGSAEKGAVSEITSKEAANFGQRSNNETTASGSQQQQQVTTNAATKSKTPPPAPVAVSTPAQTQSSPSTTTTTSSSTSSTTTTTTAPSTTPNSSKAPEQQKHRASDRQQAAPHSGAEVELLASAPSSWQSMTAVEAPAAALIAAGTRPAAATPTQDLSSSSSEESGDVLRATSTKGSYTASQSVGETFSRLRQQSSKTSQQQQQTFFYPQQRAQGKTSTYQATKTHWYQPSTTTPRPAPIIQEQQYEQQNEQYVEQQQVEGAAPPGLAEPFAFDFKTQDNSGNGQYRKEESDKNGVVRGSYGYTDASGIYRHVEYVADQNGFRANIKSNEPGLIGETQPASIRLDGGAAPATSQRVSASPNNNNNDGGDWTAASSSSNERADLALAPPDFESAHKSERLRAPRHFRN